MSDKKRRQSTKGIELKAGMQIRDYTLIEEKPFYFPNRQRKHAGGWLVKDKQGTVSHIESVELKRYTYREPLSGPEKGSPGKSVKGIKLQAGQVIRNMTLLETVTDENGKHFWKVQKEDGSVTQILSCTLKRSISTKAHCGSEESTVNWKYKHYKRSALDRNLEFNLPKAKFKELLFADCSYCGSEPESVAMYRKDGKGIVVNGIDRIDNNVGYIEENTVPCCKFCNYAKRDRSAKEYVEWLEKAGRYQAQF